MQGLREPNVGPGSAQITRISGFVNLKTDGENATVFSGLSCDLKKKGLQGKIPQFSQDFDVISKKNNKKKRSSVFHILISQCHFDGPSEAHGHSARLPEANRPHDGPPDGTPKVHRSRGRWFPLPPSRRPWKDAVLPGRNDAEMGLANLFNASA